MNRSHRRILTSAGLSIVASAAGAASASTIDLTNGDAGGGMTLNASTVLLAAGAVDSSTLATEVIQGVTFTPMTDASTGVTSSANGVTITTSAVSDFSRSVGSNSFEYAASSVNDSTMTYTSSTSLGFAGSQPSDTNSTRLAALINGGLEAKGTTTVTVTVSGLTSGKLYTIDLIQSNDGYGDRTQSVTFNGTLVDGGYLYTQGGNVGGSNSFGYDTNDTVAAVGGQIVITLTALNSADNQTSTDNDSTPLFNDIVVSTPEPASLGLIGMGCASLLARRRRRA